MFDQRRAKLWRRFLFCCFIAIFGVRAFCVERFAASIALVDEWEATGKEVLAAWQRGTFSWAALFQAHNGDHRIVATRLWEILWFELNGAWDPKMMMVLKCLIYAGAATLFTNLIARGVPRHRYATAAACAAIFAFPFGYQNLLWAFQSQFDFFLLAAAAGWWALCSGRPVWALVIAAVSPLTLGAGPIIAASYLFYGVVSRWERRWSMRRACVFSAACIVIVLAGVSLRTAEASTPGPIGAQAYTLLKLLGWPYSNLLLLLSRWPESGQLIPTAAVDFPSRDHSAVVFLGTLLRDHPAVLIAIITVTAAVMVAPLGFAGWLFFRRPESRAALLGPLCLGAFSLLLQAASAVARATEVMVQTRYLDVVQLTGIASAAAALVMVLAGGRHRRWLLVWGALVLPGYIATMSASVIQLRHSKEAEWVVTVRKYFPSHDRALLPANTHRQLPIFEEDPTAFENLLDDPAVIPILPRSITQADPVPQPLASAVFSVARHGLILAWLAGATGWLLLRRAGAGTRSAYPQAAAPVIQLET